jgi:flagellar protein FlaG
MIRHPTAPAVTAASPVAEAPARVAPQVALPGGSAAATAAVTAQARAAVTTEELRRATEQANERLRQTGSELTFEFNDEVGRVVVRLVDTRTREVLRQFPSEEMLHIARALKQDKLAGALLRAAA